MLNWSDVLGAVGPLSLCVLFVILGLMSRRLGRVTRTGPYYAGFFGAALLVGVSLIVRLVNMCLGLEQAASFWPPGELVAIYTGLPAIGITVAAFVTWRYWSWLLAERN